MKMLLDVCHAEKYAAYEIRCVVRWDRGDGYFETFVLRQLIDYQASPTKIKIMSNWAVLEMFKDIYARHGNGD